MTARSVSEIIITPAISLLATGRDVVGMMTATRVSNMITLAMLILATRRPVVWMMTARWVSGIIRLAMLIQGTARHGVGMMTPISETITLAMLLLAT